MSKALIPALFRGQVEAELKLIEAWIHHGMEVMELYRALGDFKPFGRAAEMDYASLPISLKSQKWL